MQLSESVSQEGRKEGSKQAVKVALWESAGDAAAAARPRRHRRRRQHRRGKRQRHHRRCCLPAPRRAGHLQARTHVRRLVRGLAGPDVAAPCCVLRAAYNTPLRQLAYWIYLLTHSPTHPPTYARTHVSHTCSDSFIHIPAATPSAGAAPRTPTCRSTWWPARGR